jgi:hypothetical protein
MRAGGGKSKGSQFERDVAKRLSLWVTAGKKEDVYWRAAMSGGRATVAKKAGRDVRQSGDIVAVAPEGHALTNLFYIECKFYADLCVDSFLIENVGVLAKFWQHANKEAAKYQRCPMLIVKENRRDVLLIADVKLHRICNPRHILRLWQGPNVYLFDEVMQSKFIAPPLIPKHTPRPQPKETTDGTRATENR